jgi:hypothetical protein
VPGGGGGGGGADVEVKAFTLGSSNFLSILAKTHISLFYLPMKNTKFGEHCSHSQNI